MSILSILWSLTVFVLLRVVPALARVMLAVAFKLLTWIDGHHAAILAAASFVGYYVLDSGAAALPWVKAALVYFATSTVAGIAAPLEELEATLADRVRDEWELAEAAWYRLFCSDSEPAS